MDTQYLFINGEVITVNDRNEVVEAVAVQGDKIIAVGSNEEILAYQNDHSKVIDLKGRTLMPGFIEAHMHISGYGTNELSVSCKADHIKSIPDLLEDLRKQAEKTPKGSWVRAWGYHDQKVAEKRYPTIAELDSVSTEHPIIIVRACGHISVVNSLALKMAGVTDDTPDPEGGIYERDAHGHLTGVLIETASMKMKALSAFSDDELDQAHKLASEKLLKLGITSIHDATGQGAMGLRALMRASKTGLLKQRIYTMVGRDLVWGSHLLESGIYTGLGDYQFRIGPMKLFLDGSSSGPTVWTREPYTSDPTNYGVYYYDQVTVDEHFVTAHKQGWQITAHAQGDAAIDMMLKAIEKANKLYPRKDARHRIEHAGLAAPDLVQRMKEQQVIPTPNPAFFYEYGDGYIKNYGERTNYMFPLRSYLEHGIKACITSDSPVTDVSPMRGLHSALTRLSQGGQVVGEDERISLMDAIRMYTMNPAYASFEEHVKGSIEVGKFADLIILDRSLLKADIDDILDIQVDATMIGGEILYEHDMITTS